MLNDKAVGAFADPEVDGEGVDRPFAYGRTERQLGWYQWMVRNGYSGR